MNQVPVEGGVMHPTNESAADQTDYDVVIVGGALGGSAAAILLLEKDPSLRVLIVERSEKLGRRVGEATVEVSTFFLQRCLGLTHHLHQEHLVKNGLRFWFANERTKEIPDCSEIGGRYLSRVSAYLVDRAKLDEASLARAVELGAELRRPVRVADIELNEGGIQLVRLKGDEPLRARWVIDASGVAATLARKNDWYRPNEAHPISACWARWRGCVNWEDPALAKEYPEWSKKCFGLRGTATNHLMGDGWWAWWIPLRGDEISIGVVFDQRRVQWSKEGRQADRLKSFLMRHPVGARLLSNAECVEDDVHFRSNPAWCSKRISGDGFALVGDAAGFLDPFYSPGLDWLAFTAFGAAECVHVWKADPSKSAEIARANNERFQLSYPRWFQALYQDKYDYLGEYDLMRIAVRLDVGLYYLCVAIQPFLLGLKAFKEPYFSPLPSIPFFWWMKGYNRRLASIARARRRSGRLGRRNEHRRQLLKGFAFDSATAIMVAKAMIEWIWLELKEPFARVWSSLFSKRGRRRSELAGEVDVA